MKFTVGHYFFINVYMHIKDYIAVHIRKGKWWLFRSPFDLSLCIDPVVDEPEHAALFSGQQQQSKYLGLILSVSILLSSHLQVLPFL